jgi:heat-inducible transcriptional repressor
MSDGKVSERAQQLLKILVERYLVDGQPVASKSISLGMSLSPATVRNVMAELEEQGFLSSLHTSSGRVPTTLGLRFFVDALLTVQPLDKVEVSKVERELGAGISNVPALIESTSSLLSEITRLAGIVTMPKRESLVLAHIEFVSLSENRVLAIVVLNDSEIQNRIIFTDKPYTREQLQQIANYLNNTFANTDLQEVRNKIVQSMRQDRMAMDESSRAALAMADLALEQPHRRQDDEVILAGTNNLLDLADTSDIERLRQLFEIFIEKQQVLHMVERCLIADRVQIFIGEESGHQAFQECSLVAAPYSIDGKMVGAIGVIGPTRMAYDKVIPVVDVTARLLGQILSASEKGSGVRFR